MEKKNPETWVGEVIDVWTSSGLTGKVLMVFACIGASTTLTSLTETIIEWRGLIAETLNFYTQYIRNPVAAVISFVTFDILRPSGVFVDAMLLYLIYFSAVKRAIGKLNEASSTSSAFFISFVIMLPFVLLAFLLSLLYLVDRYWIEGAWQHAGTISVVLPLVLITISIYQGILELVWLRKGHFPKSLTPESHPIHYSLTVRKFIQFVTPMVVALLVLLVLTSINLSFTEV